MTLILIISEIVALLLQSSNTGHNSTSEQVFGGYNSVSCYPVPVFILTNHDCSKSVALREQTLVQLYLRNSQLGGIRGNALTSKDMSTEYNCH